MRNLGRNVVFFKDDPGKEKSETNSAVHLRFKENVVPESTHNDDTDEEKAEDVEPFFECWENQDLRDAEAPAQVNLLLAIKVMTLFSRMRKL